MRAYPTPCSNCNVIPFAPFGLPKARPAAKLLYLYLRKRTPVDWCHGPPLLQSRRMVQCPNIEGTTNSLVLWLADTRNVGVGRPIVSVSPYCPGQYTSQNQPAGFGLDNTSCAADAFLAPFNLQILLNAVLVAIEQQSVPNFCKNVSTPR